MTGNTIWQLSPVPAYFCCGWVKSPMYTCTPWLVQCNNYIIAIIFYSSFYYVGNYFCKYCWALFRLKLDTKMGHLTTPPGTFRPLLDKLGSWNSAQTLIRLTRIRNRTHFHPNPTHLKLTLGGKLKTLRFKSKVFPSWALLTCVLFVWFSVHIPYLIHVESVWIQLPCNHMVVFIYLVETGLQVAQCFEIEWWNS